MEIKLDRKKNHIAASDYKEQITVIKTTSDFKIRKQCRHEQNRSELYGKKRERNAYKNNRTSQISTRYYPNFKSYLYIPLTD